MDTLFNKKNLPIVVLNIATIVIVAIMLTVNLALAKPERAISNNALTAGVLSYQGTLMDTSSSPLAGIFEMTFRIYSVPSGGTPLWEEIRSGANAVPVENGLFNVMLGSLIPIPDNVWESSDLFLGVKIGTDSELTPRDKLSGVPFAQIALTVPDGSISIEKLGEQPYYFYGSFATPTEWMADVIFNGNYARFCQAIGRSYSRAETLTAHYTEYPSHPRGKGNGYFYKDWYYVGNRVNDVDIHIYGNGDPADPYNVWKISAPDYPYTAVMWTFERSAIIWCK